MSTDPNLSTENQDLPLNQDGVTTVGNSEAVKDDEEIVDQTMDNTLDDPEDTSASHQSTDQNVPHENITGNISDNSDVHRSTKDVKVSQQEIPTNAPQVVNDQVFTTKPPSGMLASLTLEYLKQLLDSIIDRSNKNFKNLSDSITQLKAKDERILQENTKLHLDLTEENKRLSLEIASLNERLAKLEESAKFKFDALVQDALKQDDPVWDEDNEECQKYIEQAKFWHSKTEALYTSILTAISDCGDRIDRCGELMQEINKESSSLYKSLLNRYESLEISKRMLERLKDPVELLKKSTLPSEELMRLREQDLVDLLRSQTEEAEAKKILDKKIKETGDTRYKAVREWRDLAEKLQKQWLSFIEKKLLPVLDGINDGKRHTEHLVDELRPSYQTQTCQEKLSAWLQTYADLENILVDSLKDLGINQMSVERGQPVDYNRHEPLTTEPDPNLPYESVKEVTRNGYEYKLPDQEQPLILRTAQVIVVKNN